MKSEQTQQAFNLTEASSYIGVCGPTMLSLIRANEIPARKIGKRRWLISKATLDKWLEEGGKYYE